MRLYSKTEVVKHVHSALTTAPSMLVQSWEVSQDLGDVAEKVLSSKLATRIMHKAGGSAC